jgi:hypothetical protein
LEHRVFQKFPVFDEHVIIDGIVLFRCAKNRGIVLILQVFGHKEVSVFVRTCDGKKEDSVLWMVKEIVIVNQLAVSVGHVFDPALVLYFIKLEK